jgi:hypothetical protein
MTSLDINAAISIFALEGAWPVAFAEVVQSIVAVCEIMLLQNLFCTT